MLTLFKRVLIASLFFLWAVCSYAEGLKDKFDVWIEVYNQSGFSYRPQANHIALPGVIQTRPFRVVLKNISKETQKLFLDQSHGPLDCISFEITDENNNQNVVTKKIDPKRSQMSAYQYLAPGQTKEFDILMSPKEWDNSFKLVMQGARKLRARVLYKSGSETIYSDYYDFVIEN
jgi:hypothetical protein